VFPPQQVIRRNDTQAGSSAGGVGNEDSVVRCIVMHRVTSSGLGRRKVDWWPNAAAARGTPARMRNERDGSSDWVRDDGNDDTRVVLRHRLKTVHGFVDA
jgi:hypothetical protein